MSERTWRRFRIRTLLMAVMLVAVSLAFSALTSGSPGEVSQSAGIPRRLLGAGD